MNELRGGKMTSGERGLIFGTGSGLMNGFDSDSDEKFW
jgi:hypothetical protein